MDCDLKAFFDTVQHDRLMTQLREKIHDMLEDGKGIEAFDDWRAQRATGTDPMGGDTGPAKTAWDIITTAADEYNDPLWAALGKNKKRPA